MPVTGGVGGGSAEETAVAGGPVRGRGRAALGPDMSGRTLGGRYEMLRRIGRGGMAVVYAARDATLDRDVAVKMMLPQFAEDEGFSRRFYIEAKSAAGLQCPNIVSVYDWGQDEATGSYYIVMELLSGTDLKTMIADGGAMPCRRAASIARQICVGLEAAHARGIVHRDVKPQNVMVSPDGVAKITDFGIARPSDVHLTSSRSVLGTAQYISPEQTRGQQVTPASDIYSLGIVMYECVTGLLPFDGGDAITVALKQVRERPVPPSQVNPDVDPVMDRLILKCMAKSPEARFSSAGELREALDAYLAGRGVAVAPPDETLEATPVAAVATGPDAGAAKAGRGRVAAVTLGVVAAVALLVAAAFAIPSLLRGDEPETPAAAARVRVPDVTGMRLSDARAAIEEAGLSVGDVTQEYSDSVPEGRVASQTPQAGEADGGVRVSLSVSRGPRPPETVSVPSLVGMGVGEAEAMLKSLGLQASVADGRSDTVASGKVMEQSPSAGSTVAAGGTVTLTVSRGRDAVEVPSLEGMTRTAAKAALEAAGLSLGTVDQEASGTVATGLVSAQGIAAGTAVRRGTSVPVTVSTGPETVNVGGLGLVGMTVAEAKNALYSYGVTVRVEGDDSLSAVVQDVRPTSVERGGTVTIEARAAGREGPQASDAGETPSQSESGR